MRINISDLNLPKLLASLHYHAKPVFSTRFLSENRASQFLEKWQAQGSSPWLQDFYGKELSLKFTYPTIDVTSYVREHGKKALVAALLESVEHSFDNNELIGMANGYED